MVAAVDGRNTVVMALAVEKSGDITEVAAAVDADVMPIVAQAITEKRAVTLAANRYLNKYKGTPFGGKITRPAKWSLFKSNYCFSVFLLIAC